MKAGQRGAHSDSPQLGINRGGPSGPAYRHTTVGPHDGVRSESQTQRGKRGHASERFPFLPRRDMFRGSLRVKRKVRSTDSHLQWRNFGKRKYIEVRVVCVFLK